MLTSLAASGPACKPDVAMPDFWHLSRMRSALTELFVRRVREEMGVRSGNALAKAAGIGQRTIARILRGEQDPSLSIVQEIARALGLPAWYLLMNAEHAEQRVIRAPLSAQAHHISKLPSYPPVFTAAARSKKSRRQTRG